MPRPRQASLWDGIVVGLTATQALDWLSILIYENEAASTRYQEDQTRGHRHAYEVAVARLAKLGGKDLSRESTVRWGWRFHKVFGILGGIGYLKLRRSFPALQWGCGLAFGTAFFLIADELMVPAFRLTPGPLAFSWKVHARGAAAHLAYGVAAEATARALDRR